MKGIEDTKKELPRLKDDEKMYVYLQGTHFQQTNVIITNNKNEIDIYVVYNLDPIASTRGDTFTVQNALFGAMEIIKIADTSKCKIIKGMTYVLMKVECLVKGLLTTEGTY